MVSDVLDAVKHLKRGKHDGNIGYFSDHIINGSPRLYVQLSLLFSSMLSHGYVPKDFLLSSTPGQVPIPKNRRKSLNNSDNYRAIALGSILGKLLDIILLRKCSNVFQTSDLRFDFIECFTTTFLRAHSWLNWVDEDDDEHDEVGLKSQKTLEATRYIKKITSK